jgi:hypothetical protein
MIASRVAPLAWGRNAADQGIQEDEMEVPPADLPGGPLRPGDYARFALAASGAPPRARARDQQADLVGESLRRCVLDRLVALDPEPEALESALMAIVAELGEPTGSTRAICSVILQEWEMARLGPRLLPFLIDQAIRADQTSRRAAEDRSPSPPATE